MKWIEVDGMLAIFDELMCTTQVKFQDSGMVKYHQHKEGFVVPWTMRKGSHNGVDDVAPSQGEISMALFKSKWGKKKIKSSGQ